MNNLQYDLIGKGSSFPMNRSDRGGLAITDEINRINQSIFIILETPLGNRLMLPEFGSELSKYKFDPIDSILEEKLSRAINKALSRWEPRIKLEEITFLDDPEYVDQNILYISLKYKIINSNAIYNYVYPYRTEPYDTLDN